MPKAGFYSIHTDVISFGADGRWYADGEPVVHQRLAKLFSRHLVAKDGGGYEIRIDENYRADVEVEDTPFVVVSISQVAADRILLRLNDDSEELLAPESLYVGDSDVLYCSVKDSSERARFLRSAYYQLSEFLEAGVDDVVGLRLGTTLTPISQR